MRRRKDTKAAIVDVNEARAVCVRGATLDSRVASLIGSVGAYCAMARSVVVLVWCHVASVLMMRRHAQFNRNLRLFSRDFPSPSPSCRVGWGSEMRLRMRRHWHGRVVQVAC